MNIPDVGIGAVVAAVIAAALSFLGLLISKEQKISDFRQAWIDSVRSDISSMLSSANAIRLYAMVEKDQPIAFWKAVRADSVVCSEAIYRLKLRLNPYEDCPLRILKLINRIEEFLNGEMSADDFPVFVSIEVGILEESVGMLKTEWERVKEGEKIFRVAKLVALAMLIAAGFILFRSMI